jgi:hypothetical protein
VCVKQVQSNPKATPEQSQSKPKTTHKATSQILETLEILANQNPKSSFARPETSKQDPEQP